jgi:hypothetical protein
MSKEKGCLDSELAAPITPIDIDAETREQLEAIALATNGAYYDAKDADQLKQSLEEIKKRTFEGYEASGKDVKASPWIAEAPEVQSENYKEGIFLHELKFYKTNLIELESEVEGNDEIYVSLTTSDNHTAKGEIVELYDYNQVDSTKYSLLITSE